VRLRTRRSAGRGTSLTRVSTAVTTGLFAFLGVIVGAGLWCVAAGNCSENGSDPALLLLDSVQQSVSPSLVLHPGASPAGFASAPRHPPSL
jgi:hypothetical protein